MHGGARGTLGAERDHALMGRAGLQRRRYAAAADGRRTRRSVAAPGAALNRHDPRAGRWRARPAWRPATTCSPTGSRRRRAPSCRALPAAWASRLLLAAIARHAWTFCGSGEFKVLRHAIGPGRRGCRCPPARLPPTHADEPLCDYFRGDVRAPVPVARRRAFAVVEIECTAMGAPSCVFEITW